jgi:hypothetical protein
MTRYENWRETAPHPVFSFFACSLITRFISANAEMPDSKLPQDPE